MDRLDRKWSDLLVPMIWELQVFRLRVMIRGVYICLLIQGIKDWVWIRLYGRRKLFGNGFNSKREDEFKKIVFEKFPKEFSSHLDTKKIKERIDREWSQRLIKILREEYLKEEIPIVDTQDYTRIYKNK